jgi:cell division protein FtsZ
MCCFGDVFSISRHSIIETIKCISELIHEPSLWDIDYADIQAIMCKGGLCVLLYGETKLSDPPDELVRSCLNHPVNDIDYQNASGILILFIGGNDMTLMHTGDIARLLSAQIQPHADVIWGARIDTIYEGRMRMIAIMTGIGNGVIP